MENYDNSILTDKEKYTQELLANETAKMNKVSTTNIYTYLTSNIKQFKAMHKEMHSFDKEFLGHAIGEKLLDASNAYMTAYISTNRELKIKNLKYAIMRLNEISNLLKMGYTTNSFVNDTYAKFFEKHILTKNAINAFLASQIFAQQEEDEKLLKMKTISTSSEQTS